MMMMTMMMMIVAVLSAIGAIMVVSGCRSGLGSSSPPSFGSPVYNRVGYGKTETPAVLVASYMCADLDHFNAIIDLFCFRSINRSVLVNNTDNKQDLAVFEKVFQELHKEGPIGNFEEKYGRRLAVYIASQLLIDAGDCLPEHLRLFVDLVAKLPIKADGNATMVLIRSFFGASSFPSINTRLESIIIFFMMLVLKEEGRPVGKFFSALFGSHIDGYWAMNGITRFTVSPDNVRRLCVTLVGHEGEQLFGNIMQSLDKLSAKSSINLLLGDPSLAKPDNFQSFFAMTSKIDEPICWCDFLGLVMKGAQQYLSESDPGKGEEEWAERVNVAMLATLPPEKPIGSQ